MDGSNQPPGSGRYSERHFHHENRRNRTHASTTTRMPSSIAKAAAEPPNDTAVVVATMLTPARGTAEGEAKMGVSVRQDLDALGWAPTKATKQRPSSPTCGNERMPPGEAPRRGRYPCLEPRAAIALHCRHRILIHLKRQLLLVHFDEAMMVLLFST
jgi:hypothetical protein